MSAPQHARVRRAAALGLTALGLTAAVLPSACSAPPVAPPANLEFATRMVARAERGPAHTSQPVDDAMSATINASASVPLPGAEPVEVAAQLPAKTRADEWRGLVDVPDARLAELERTVEDENALATLLAAPLPVGDLAALAVLRSPAVRKARARYEAARTTFTQSEDLGDLIQIYRSFVRDTETRVGPERSRRSTEMIAPSPDVNGISAEVAKRTTEMAFESLRTTVRDMVARAWNAHSDAARLFEARKIVREEVELDAVLLEVLRSRLESGTGSQAGFLAFESRLERLKTELDILDRQETVVRAQWNQLLSRPEAAEVALGEEPEVPASAPSREAEPQVIKQAIIESQELRTARLAAERAELGVRLAETMVLPRMDVGSSRFERERAGEAGIQRGAVFPAPGRMVMPRSDFGVREAQVQEMRSRAVSMSEARDALRDQVRTKTRAALFGVDAATQRVGVHERELVPLARDSLDAARGAYEGNRTGYLDLLDAVHRLLDARLGLADARRNLVRAHATLLRAVGVKISDRK